MSKKIRKNDDVIILTGKDKGKIGKVINVISNKVIVQGINIVKKSQKPEPTFNRPGGIIEKESKIHISNVAIFNKKTGKSDRIGFKFENKKKIRFFKKSGEKINKS
ncbi:50S ribosomal protein L24 [Candidatus Riesia sp. GBBU]|nr:50S ribosomal protein L24 [Candidatus Riesia sp. GBBU]